MKRRSPQKFEEMGMEMEMENTKRKKTKTLAVEPVSVDKASFASSLNLLTATDKNNEVLEIFRYHTQWEDSKIQQILFEHKGYHY
jgi:hypothetical protein